MHRLTREVRFSVYDRPDDQLSGKPSNSYSGFPSMRGFGRYFDLRVTVGGELDPESQYLVNIKKIDEVVRTRAIPLVESAVRGGEPRTPETLVAALVERVAAAWLPLLLEELSLSVSPFLSYAHVATEPHMVRLSQKFEFSATHRLHNPALSAEENCRVYGKCNNPHGHGHNYELQVTLRGTPDPKTGVVIDVPAFERVVASAVIDRFDHKNLNVELPEFRDVIPSVENIARVIYGLLKPKIAEAGSELSAVTVWETPKTWCEYSE